MTPDPTTLEETIGYCFNEKQLLLTALTHPSFSAEQEPPVPDNQRLEFLGDAVLHLSLTDLLFEAEPSLAEGQLTIIRSALSNAQALARLAGELGLGPLLRVGRGENQSKGQNHQSNLADALEAVLAAVYLDGGFGEGRAVCARLYLDALRDPQVSLVSENPKGALQELTQETHGATPQYRTLRLSGPEHQPEFEVGVTVSGRELASARAGSRKAAEKRAATLALQVLRTEHDRQEGA